jgi:CheY-like chemotaxis protein
MFAKRIGPDPHENGAQSAACRGCPDIWELDNGDYAVIGIDITDAATPKLPPTAGCGPDGLTFVRALRRMLPDIPVMVASGRLDDALAEEFKTLGVTNRLDKPFTGPQLAETLQTVLKKQNRPANDRISSCSQ